ncbi:MAG: hypothetical protein Q7S00_03035, partial [bacterium]|nr:hypothetical protein [bacterium]
MPLVFAVSISEPGDGGDDRSVLATVQTPTRPADEDVFVGPPEDYTAPKDEFMGRFGMAWRTLWQEIRRTRTSDELSQIDKGGLFGDIYSQTHRIPINGNVFFYITVQYDSGGEFQHFRITLSTDQTTGGTLPEEVYTAGGATIDDFIRAFKDPLSPPKDFAAFHASLEREGAIIWRQTYTERDSEGNLRIWPGGRMFPFIGIRLASNRTNGIFIDPKGSEPYRAAETMGGGVLVMPLRQKYNYMTPILEQIMLHFASHLWNEFESPSGKTRFNQAWRGVVDWGRNILGMRSERPDTLALTIGEPKKDEGGGGEEGGPASL